MEIALLLLVTATLIWVIRLHEVLRNLGNQIAKLQSNFAQKLPEKSNTVLPPPTPPVQPFGPNRVCPPPMQRPPMPATIKTALLLPPQPEAVRSDALKTPVPPVTSVQENIPEAKNTLTDKALQWICAGEENPAEKLSNEYTTVTTWLIRGGVLAVLASIGFLLKLSFDRQYFTTQTLIVLLTVTGLMIALGGALGVACKKESKYRNWLLTVSGGGFALTFFALFAGYGIYQVYPEWLTFVLLIAVSFTAIVTAWKTDAMSIGIVGCIGGFSAPLFFGAVNLSCFSFVWISAINLGVLWLSYRKRWVLQYCAVTLLYAVSALYIFDTLSGRYFFAILPLLFLNCFIPFLPCLLKCKEHNFLKVHLACHIFSLIIMLAMAIPQALKINNYLAALVTFIICLINAMGMYRNYRSAILKNFFSIVSCVMVAATVYFLLQGTVWLTAFWSFTAIMMAIGARRSQIRALGVFSVFLLLLTVFTLPEFLPPEPYLPYLLHNISSYWIYVLSIIFVGTALHQIPENADDESLFVNIPGLLFLLGGVAAFACLTVECWQFLNIFLPEFSKGGISIVWGITGVFLLAFGIRKKILALRLAAIVIFLAAALKVLIFDTANLGGFWRSIVIAAFGILLLLAALLYIRRKDIFRIK